jgi:hypothetical protein
MLAWIRHEFDQCSNIATSPTFKTPSAELMAASGLFSNLAGADAVEYNRFLSKVSSME